jgi:hypothetical protein
MKINSLKKIAVVFIAMLMTFVLPANAQAIVSSTSTVQLSYVVGESISVAGAPPSLVFAGSPIPTTGSLTITTSWVLAPTRVRLDTNLFFATPTAALTNGGGSNIPSSEVFANINGGNYSACNTNPASDVASVAVTGGTCNVGFGGTVATLGVTGTHTDVFILQLQGFGTLNAGTYTGQLNIVAGAA